MSVMSERWIAEGSERWQWFGVVYPFGGGQVGGDRKFGTVGVISLAGWQECGELVSRHVGELGQGVFRPSTGV